MTSQLQANSEELQFDPLACPKCAKRACSCPDQTGASEPSDANEEHMKKWAEEGTREDQKQLTASLQAATANKKPEQDITRIINLDDAEGISETELQQQAITECKLVDEDTRLTAAQAEERKAAIMRTFTNKGGAAEAVIEQAANSAANLSKQEKASTNSGTKQTQNKAAYATPEQNIIVSHNVYARIRLISSQRSRVKRKLAQKLGINDNDKILDALIDRTLAHMGLNLATLEAALDLNIAGNTYEVAGHRNAATTEFNSHSRINSTPTALFGENEDHASPLTSR